MLTWVFSLVSALQEGELPRRESSTGEVDEARVETELGEFISLPCYVTLCLTDLVKTTFSARCTAR